MITVHPPKVTLPVTIPGHPQPLTALEQSLCYNLTMHTQSFPNDQRADHDGPLVQVADRVGATASFLCALHCAALPFVLALLPALGLSFLADHSFERWFIAFATALALTMMIRGYRRHGAPQALFLLLPGLVLLWLGGYVFDLESSGLWHALLVSLGGTAVALAHIINLRLTNLHRYCCANGRSAIV